MTNSFTDTSKIKANFTTTSITADYENRRQNKSTTVGSLKEEVKTNLAKSFT